MTSAMRGPIQISYDAGGSLALIEFDATLSELHAGSNVVTEHPVETGVNVTDHVRPEVERVMFEVFVTNHPIRVPKTNLDGASGDFAPLPLEVADPFQLPIAIPGVGAALKGAGTLDNTTIVNANTLQFDDFDRVGSVYHELKTLRETATLITIVTSLQEYEKFVIQNMGAPRQTGQGDAISFQVEARALKFVTTQTVKAPASPAAVKKLDKGPKTAVKEVPKSSLARKAVKALGLAQ